MVIGIQDLCQFVRGEHDLVINLVFKIKSCDGKANKWLGSDRTSQALGSDCFGCITG